MQNPAPQQLPGFRDKVVLVTGAAKGIGRGIALRFVEAGADVAVHYHRSAEGAAEVVGELEHHVGRRALAAAADLTQPKQTAALVREVIEKLGRLDVLINNAGSYPVTPLLETSPEQWREVIACNLDSVHYCTQSAARHMREHGGGAIVNIASIEAEVPAPGHSHYCAAKAAVAMYTRCAAQELGKFNIRVNAVSPGLIWRPGLDEAWPQGVAAYRTAAPLGRLGQADEVADACVFLASDAARWITGANLVVDGGVLTQRAF